MMKVHQMAKGDEQTAQAAVDQPVADLDEQAGRNEGADADQLDVAGRDFGEYGPPYHRTRWR